VARYGGGDNAGHTVTVGAERFALHLIPSGILYPDVVCLLGAGMVVNPKTLAGRDGGPVGPGRRRLACKRLRLDGPGPPDHALSPGPRRRCRAARGGSALGTTKRGIGPAYTDKAARSGIRACELLHPPGDLAVASGEQAQAKNTPGKGVWPGAPGRGGHRRRVPEHMPILVPHVADVSAEVFAALRSRRRILAEGAQGTLLDLDFGSYPYVTSSHPTTGGVLIGLGIGPQYMGGSWASSRPTRRASAPARCPPS
jgi:adenylosuccinate synthase